MPNIFLFLIDNGKVPADMVFLLLLLPFIATIVAFTRQIVGIKMFNAYAPMLAVYAFLGTGFVPGIVISLIIFLVSLVLRALTKHLRIHYLPRIAFLIATISIIVLIAIPFAVNIPNFSLENISSTSIILFILLSDVYLTSEIQKGAKVAGKLYIETIAVAVVIFFIASWQPFQVFLIYHPEIIILSLVIDLFIGRWKGLRITEIWRFRNIIKEKSKDYA